jgi:hypothetical protein
VNQRQARLLEVRGREDEQTGDEGGREGGEHRREEPSRPPSVEAAETEAPRFELAQDQPGDQVAADDEEDIDADEAAAKAGDAAVEEQNCEYRDRAQTVHLGPVGVARNRWRGCGGRIGTRRHRPSDDTRRTPV